MANNFLTREDVKRSFDYLGLKLVLVAVGAHAAMGFFFLAGYSFAWNDAAKLASSGGAISAQAERFGGFFTLACYVFVPLSLLLLLSIFWKAYRGSRQG